MSNHLYKLGERSSRPLRYLALGDSYTFGEGLVEKESFPYQLVAELRNRSVNFLPPEIIAQTGWTTKELQRGIEDVQIEGETYDLITLMAGVNNQFRGESIKNFQLEFSELVDLSISFANGNPTRVIVISIPDWGVTPFATIGNYPSERISGDIDHFNRVIQMVVKEKKVLYLDITQQYRQIGGLPANLISDQLHPSGEVYKCWAQSLRKMIDSEVKGFKKKPG